MVVAILNSQRARYVDSMVITTMLIL
jgi:hypothetical protein